MKRNGKRQSNLKRLLSITLVCGLMLTFFVPGVTASAGTIIEDRDISAGGSYVVPSTWSGTIYISTQEPVTLSPQTAGKVYDNLKIRCTSAGTDLTLNGINVTLQEDETILSFTGKGNKLRLAEGENILKNNQEMESLKASTENLTTDKSIIHVPAGVELSIYGPGTVKFDSLPVYDDRYERRYTYLHACPIGGNNEEEGGTIHVMGGGLYNLNDFDTTLGLIGGGYKQGMETLDIRGGKLYGKLGTDYLQLQVGGKLIIDGDCVIRGPINMPYTFTRGVLTDTKKQKTVIRGVHFTLDEDTRPYVSVYRSFNYKELIVENGAQFTVANLINGYDFGTAQVRNYGTIVIANTRSTTIFPSTPDFQPPGAQLYNYGTVVINPGAVLNIGGTAYGEMGGIADATLVNYPSGVIENNGSLVFAYTNNLVANMGEIRGNAVEGVPVYDTEFHSRYQFTTDTATYVQNVETDLNLKIRAGMQKYLGYDSVGVKVTSITQPEGVKNGLILKEVADDGTASAVEIGKLWNGGKGFTLPVDQDVARPMKLLGNDPGEYQVGYALVNLEDNTEITTGTLTYTVDAAPVETLSTLTGITVNGKAITPFDKTTLTYETEIRGDAEELTVSATMSNPDASYTVVKPDVPVEGENVVTISCTSQDQSSTTVYTVNVSKPKLIEGIKALYLDGVPCEDFDSQKTNSIVIISDTQMESKFTYTLMNSSDRVLLDTLSSKKLRVGNNVCIVRIGDRRGAQKVQYAITVKVVKGSVVPGERPSDNTNLKSLTVNGISAALTNDPSKIINVVLNDSRTVAAITATAEDSQATLTYTASLSIRPGNNLTTITVKSSDQSRQVRYTLCIRRQTLDNVSVPSAGAGDNTALKSLTVGGVPAVIPASGSIVVAVGRITDQPVIVAAAEDPQATVQIKYLTAKVKTGNNMAQITVQSSDQSKTKTYMLVYQVS